MTNQSGLRLVVCSTGIPHKHFHPKLSAGLMILYTYLSHFKRQGAQILHVLILDDKNFDADILARYKQEQEDEQLKIVVWRTPSYLLPRRHLWDPVCPRPLSDDMQKTIAAFAPDAIFCLNAYAAGTLGAVQKAPILVQEHDPHFQVLWYHALYALKEHPLRPMQPLIDLAKSFLWKPYYRRALAHAHTVITVAASGAQGLKRIGIRAKLFPMAWDVTTPSTPAPALPTKPTFVFQGNLSGLGSRAALHFIFDRAFPLIRKKWGSGGFEILCCGTRSLPCWVAKRIEKLPEVRFLGFVDDIAALLRSCHAVLAPIEVPIGNRTRILTAMALGVPAIGHRSIASANPHLIDGQTCLLAATPEEFVEKMALAYERGPAIEHIIQEAKRVYDQQFSAKAASEALFTEIQTMIAAYKAVAK